MNPSANKSACAGLDSNNNAKTIFNTNLRFRFLGILIFLNIFSGSKGLVNPSP